MLLITTKVFPKVLPKLGTIKTCVYGCLINAIGVFGFAALILFQPLGYTVQVGAALVDVAKLRMSSTDECR